LSFGTSALAKDVNKCDPLSWDLNEECLYKINDLDFHISPKGGFKIVSSTGVIAEQKITLPEHFFIESVSHEPIGENFLIILGITDADAGSSVLALFNKKEMEIKWQTEIGAFNISEPLIGKDAIYVGAIGTVAKIDRDTGAIIWRHQWLYESDTGAFNSFIRPVKDGQVVRFIEEKQPRAKYSKPREIVVEDISGDILSK